MSGTYDVTVRVPVGFESAAEMAGWVQAAISEAMWQKNWTGEAAVLFRKDDNGPIIMFHQGIVDPYDGVLPHGLVDPLPVTEPETS